MQANQEMHALGALESSTGNGRDTHVAQMVEVTTLDEALAGLLEPTDNVSFIKIEVEGHELSVLCGAWHTIEKFWPVLLVEIEFRHSTQVEETFSFLQQRRYQAFSLIDNDRLSPITVESLRLLQSDERLTKKLERTRYFGYVNNVFFIPAAA